MAIYSALFLMLSIPYNNKSQPNAAYLFSTFMLLPTLALVITQAMVCQSNRGYQHQLYGYSGKLQHEANQRGIFLCLMPEVKQQIQAKADKLATFKGKFFSIAAGIIKVDKRAVNQVKNSSSSTSGSNQY
jgi:hypothetical protein